MSKSSEIQREQEIASEARPLIVARLREREDPLRVAAAVSDQYSVDETKAFRWVTLISEDFERRRKRIGIIGLLVLWPGLLMLAGGPLLSLLGVGIGGPPLWLLGLAAGVPLTGCGLFVSFRARHLVRDTV